MMLEAALAYASQGFHVFPILPGQKRPLTQHGFKEATTDPEQIRAWWTVTPEANIGFVPGRSGLVAIDIDPRHDPDPELIARLPATMTIKTPRGEHRYYDAGGKSYSNRKLAQGIDVRSTNGYTLLPPSVIDYRETDDLSAWGEYEWASTL